MLLAVLNLYFWLLAHFLSDCGTVRLASLVCYLAQTLVALVTNPWNIDRLSWNHLAHLFFFFFSLLDPSLISVLNLAGYAVWNSFPYLEDFS